MMVDPTLESPATNYYSLKVKSFLLIDVYAKRNRDMKYLALILLINLCSCCCYDLCDIADFYIAEPSTSGLTGYKPGTAWDPPEDYTRLCVPLELDPELDDQRVDLKKTMELGDLINIALLNNPLTERTWSQARAAAFNLGSAKSQYYPTVELEESYSWNDSNFVPKKLTSNSTDTTTTVTGINQGSSFGKTSFQELSSTIIVSYLLMDFGGRSASVEAARQALYFANWAYNQSIQDVILEVLRAYYNYLLNIASVEATEENLKDVTKNLEAAQELFTAGLTTRVDVLQAKSNLANTQYQLENFKGQVKIALGAVATALGLPANVVLTIERKPETVPTKEISGSLNELMDLALVYRADLAEKQAAYMQARANLIVARSEGLPIVTGSMSFNRGDYFKSSLLRSHDYVSMIEVSVPLFQGFFYEYNIRQAQANIDATYADWQDQETIVLNGVLSSYYAVKTAEESLKFSEEFLKYSQEAYDATLAGYKAGTITFLDVLASQTSLANARNQVIQTRVAWAQALSSLAYAIGILDARTEQVNLPPLFQKVSVGTQETPVEEKKLKDYP